jgi:sugar-phosphatase
MIDAADGGMAAATPLTTSGASGLAGARFAAVLVDLDGTLVDSSDSVARAWQQWCETFQVEPPELGSAINGRTAVDVIGSVRPSWSEREVRLAAAEQLRLQEEDPQPGVAVAGAADLLSKLQREHEWCIVTACSGRLAQHRLQAAGLDRPRLIVTTADVRQGKPDPESYLLAATRLGVDATHCVVVEDSPAGVTAGIAAGCRVIAVTTTHAADDLKHATIAVADLRQVALALEAWAS